MHPIISSILTREKEALQEFQFSLKKAFDLLGNVYAPVFFCAAVLVGVALPVFAWKSGGVINALLGARGVGVLTSELTRGMWTLAVALGVYFVGMFLLSRLEGKMHEVFMSLAHAAKIIWLFILSVNIVSVFFVNTVLFVAWRVCKDRRIRIALAIAWFLGLLWMLFSFAADVALRVSTLGDMVSVLAVSTLFFVAVTHQLFEKR